MYDDFEMLVDFMNGRNVFHNINIQKIRKSLKNEDGAFNLFHIVHIFREKI